MQRKNLVVIIRNNIINYLNAKKNNAEISLKSAERPEGIILEYKRLLSVAERDKKYNLGNIFFEIKSLEDNLLDEIIYLLVKGPLAKIKGNISLIITEELDDSLKNRITNLFNKYMKEVQIVITKDLKKGLECQNVMVLSTIGVTKRNELKELNKKLLLQKKPVLGLLVINSLLLTQ